MHFNEPSGALKGITILDLSRVLAGPYATQILGDHGATIIKVEPPAGDETREWGSAIDEEGAGKRTSSGYYRGANRNKMELALDIASPKGREVVLRLMATADVVVENFKTGTMKRWGLDYETDLKPRFPGLIYCRVTGFGIDGPLGGLPGYDAVIQTMSGLMSTNGAPDTGPLRVGIPLVDMVTGMNAVIGIMMALHHRQTTGQGQLVEACLWDTGVSLLHPHAGNFFVDGQNPKLTGNAHPSISPYELFDTATRPLFLGVGNDRQFAKAVLVLGLPELRTDPRFLTNPERVANRPALRALLAERFAKLDALEICEALLAEGVPAGPLNTVDEILSDPHTKHRQMVVQSGDYRGTGIPIKLSETPGNVRLPPPRFGEHNRDILGAAGYSPAEIDGLIADKIVVERRK
jgi:formyl-CoA transferase